MDVYAALQLDPNADSETIERVFRHLAARYHPDNQATGDRTRFEQVLEAHAVLRDPERRARYDAARAPDAAADAPRDPGPAEGDDIANDDAMRERIMEILYRRRRSHVREPGVGDAQLADMLEIGQDQIEFHIWFLKEKKWIAREADGSLAITIDGVERVSIEHQAQGARRRIAGRG